MVDYPYTDILIFGIIEKKKLRIHLSLSIDVELHGLSDSFFVVKPIPGSDFVDAVGELVAQLNQTINSRIP